MLDLFKKVREELLSDITITDFVGDKVYMAFKPVGNTDNDYPQITMFVRDNETDSLLRTYDLDLHIHIWTKGDARVTRAYEIAKRVILNLDVEGFEDPCIYQIWKSGSIDDYEDDTQTFHKVIMFNVVMEGYSE